MRSQPQSTLFPYTTLFRSRIVDYANRERPKGDELKVGGHQASSASMVSLMTALYFADLRAEDRVSVKPHAEVGDRKSTRLNSSHRCISYAVFCLKKKQTSIQRMPLTAGLPSTHPAIAAWASCRASASRAGTSPEDVS